jgi:hypothetical protein
MSKRSIVLPNGGISVAWEKEAVTWHIVLQTARTTNADNGGWNRKSRWNEHGLKVMASIPQELQTWTTNSLKEKAQPLPREAEFQLELRELVAKSGTRGGEKKIPQEPEQFGIKFYPKKPEDRLNWWLYMAHRHAKKLTFELPLCADADGLLRADLVHFVPESALVEIIELKKGLGKDQNDSRDSPLMALAEAICYGLQLLRCWEALKPELQQHLKVEPFEIKHLHLILAAPDFGQNCSGNGNNLTLDHQRDLRAIVSAVQQAVGDGKATIGPKITLSFANVNEKKWTLDEIPPEPGREIPRGSILDSTKK